MINHFRAEGTLDGVSQSAVVRVVPDVGGHVDLVAVLDVVAESDEVVVVCVAYGAVVFAGTLRPLVISYHIEIE